MVIKKDEIKNMPIKQEIEHIIETTNKICKRNNIDYLLLWGDNFSDQAFKAIYNNNSHLFSNELIVYQKEENLFQNLKTKQFIGNEINHYFITKRIAIIDTNTMEENYKNGNNINGNIRVFIDYTNKYVEEILSFYNILFSKSLNELELNKILRDYVILDNKDFTSKYTKEQIVNLLTTIKPQIPKNFTIYNSITENYIKNIDKDLKK